MRVIANLHTLRSHHFNAEGAGVPEQPFRKRGGGGAFRGLWRDLSEELRDYERDLVAYELLNEPTAARSEDWNRVAGAVRRTIRQEEPERLLVLGSNRWQSPDRVAELELPKEDPNLLISVHCYFPHLLTHYRAHWMALGRYQGPVDYPGVVVEEAALADLPAELREAALQPWISGFHDRDRLAEYFKAPLSIAAGSRVSGFIAASSAASSTPPHGAAALVRGYDRRFQRVLHPLDRFGLPRRLSPPGSPDRSSGCDLLEIMMR